MLSRSKKLVNLIIEYGLYLVVFLLSLQTRYIFYYGEISKSYSEYLSVSLYVVDILLIILLILFLSSQIKKYCQSSLSFLEILKKNKVLIIIVGLEIFILISIFFSTNKAIAFYKYGLFLLGVGLFYLIKKAKYNQVKLIYSLLAGMFFQASLGIWQFLTQTSFANKWLGIAQHFISQGGTAVVETGAGERWLRSYGGLDYPNILGVFLVLGLFLIIYLVNWDCCRMPNCPKSPDFNKFVLKNFDQYYYIAKNFLKQISKKSKNLCLIWHSATVPSYKKNKISLFFIFYCLLFAVLTSFSRSAWLGLIGGLLVLLVILIKKKQFLKIKKITALVVPGVILVMIIAVLYNSLIFTRLSSSNRLEIKSNTERVDLTKQAWGLIRENYLFGVGVGNYIPALVLLDEGNEQFKPAWEYQPVHNVFLLVWAEIGIFGLLFFVSLLFYCTGFPIVIIFIDFVFIFINLLVAGRKCGKISSRKNAEGLFYLFIKNKNSSINLAILFVIFIALFFDHWLWSLHFGILFFWLVMGMVSRKDFF